MVARDSPGDGIHKFSIELDLVSAGMIRVFAIEGSLIY